MNRKLKLFLENFIFYGGLSMLQKALPFITLPIITRMLPDSSSYGIADMFNLIISFGSAIAVLGMYDAVFREFFEDKDNKEYQKKVTATGLNIVLTTGLIAGFLIIIFSNFMSEIVFYNNSYSKLMVLSGISIVITSLNSIIAAPTRMRNQRKIFLITGITFPIIGFLITYISIKLGYTYEALIFGTLGMNAVSLLVFCLLNKKDFSLKIFDKKIAKELFKIGLPLVPTFLIYWLFHSMDRVMINKMLGSGELGVYSVGAKVSSVSQLIYTAFAGGWSYFSFSTMKDKDQVKINSKVFEYLGIISFLAYLLSQPFISLVFNLFFVGEYIRGKEVFGFLFLSPLMLMLYQTVGNQVIVIKKSYLGTLSLMSGAILNVCLNYILIKSHGIEGAAFSTLNSYILSVILMCGICYKYKLFIASKSFILISFILITGIYIDFFFEFYWIYNGLYFLVFVLIILNYIGDIKKVTKG